MKTKMIENAVAAPAVSSLAGCASNPTSKLVERHNSGHAGRREVMNVAPATRISGCGEGEENRAPLIPPRVA